MYKFVNKKTAVVVFIVDILGSLAFFLLYALMPWRLRRRNKVPSDPKSILVIRADYIGDVILALPAIEALKKRYPTAKITFLTSAKAKDLLTGNPFIDYTLAYDPPWFFKKPFKQAILEYARIFREIKERRFNLALDLRGDMRNIFFLTFLTGIPYRISFASSGGWYLLTKVLKYPPGLHEAQYHMEVVKAAGAIDTGINTPRIFVSPEETAFVHEFSRNNGLKRNEPIIAFHPGARKKLKQWPLENYAALGRTLRDDYMAHIAITGSADEAGLAEDLANMIGAGAFSCAGRFPSLKHLAAFYKNCALYVGCSTGPTHLAAAVGAHTVVICGPESVERWAPLGENSVLVKKEVPCRPCVGREDVCLFPESNCLKILTPDDVLQAVRTQLSRLNITPQP